VDRPPPSVRCKICGNVADFFEVCDLATHCGGPANGPQNPLGVPVDYFRCGACGFLFSCFGDNWTVEEWRTRIYNEEYFRVYDPGYAEHRPRVVADMVAKLFPDQRQTISVLDFGGGQGAMCRFLRQGGFTDAHSYDPIAQPDEPMPARQFDLVTCIEVFEHAVDPLELVRQLGALTKGLVLFSTRLQPPDIEAQRLKWSYVGPRNGHISLFSRLALTIAWKSAGMTMASFNDDLHAAFSRCPPFAAHLFHD
jgi:hypothetical protein